MSIDELYSQLERLGALRTSGLLDAAEFDAQKARLLAQMNQVNTRQAEPAQRLGSSAAAGGFGFQSAANTITNSLGLATIESFSLGNFFADVFKRHGPDELENILSAGAPLTTPPLVPAMGVLPNPWIFFRALIFSLIAYAVFHFGFAVFSNPLLLPGLIVVGAFAVPLSVLLMFFEINTPRNVSMVRVSQFLIVGGALSILLSLFLFDLSSLNDLLGAPSAGIVEECGKIAVVIGMLKFVPAHRYPYRLNALLLGAAVGTGFAAFESAGYALNYGAEAGVTQIIVSRGLLAPFMHIIWTAIAAAAYWDARLGSSGWFDAIRSKTFLKLFAAPVVLHFIWNTSFQLPFAGKQLILGFIGWVVVVSLIQTGLKEVGQAAKAQGEQDGSAVPSEPPSIA